MSVIPPSPPGGAAGGAAAAGQDLLTLKPQARRLAGVVIGLDRQRVTIEAASGRWQAPAPLSGEAAKVLKPGTQVRLEVADGRAGARLIEAGGQKLASPLALRAVLTRASAAHGAGAAPVPVRLVDGAGVQGATLRLHDLGAGGGAAARLAPATKPLPGTQPPAPALLPGRTIALEVAGREPSGGLLLRASGRLFRLEPAPDLPPGTQVRLLPVPTAADPSSPGRALDDLARALPRDGPAPELRLPQADGSLAARLVRLLQVLSEPGGAGAPDTIDLEGSAPEAQRGRLEAPLGELARLGREPLAGGWRLLLLPLGGGDEMQALRVYVPEERQPDDRDAEAPRRAAADEPRRVVLDVDFSHLGRCQLDAFCVQRSFRLMLRSAEPLAPTLRAQVADLFGAACAIAGLHGELGFGPGQLLSLPEPKATPAPPLTA